MVKHKCTLFEQFKVRKTILSLINGSPLIKRNYEIIYCFYNVEIVQISTFIGILYLLIDKNMILPQILSGIVFHKVKEL